MGCVRCRTERVARLGQVKLWPESAFVGRLRRNRRTGAAGAPPDTVGLQFIVKTKGPIVMKLIKLLALAAAVMAAKKAYSSGKAPKPEDDGKVARAMRATRNGRQAARRS